MKKNKNVIAIVLLSMLLPILFFVISVVVYEDETPWEGWTYSGNNDVVYIGDYYNLDVCIQAMEKSRIERGKTSFLCGKSCEKRKTETAISDYKCEKKHYSAD